MNFALAGRPFCLPRAAQCGEAPRVELFRRYGRVLRDSRRRPDAFGVLAAASAGFIALAAQAQESRTVSASGLRDSPASGSYITANQPAPATNYFRTNAVAVRPAPRTGDAPRDGSFITANPPVSEPQQPPRPRRTSGAPILRPGEAMPTEWPPAQPSASAPTPQPRWGADAPREGSFIVNRGPAAPTNYFSNPSTTPLPWLAQPQPAPAYVSPQSYEPPREVSVPAPARARDPRDAGYIIVGPGAYTTQTAPPAASGTAQPARGAPIFQRDPADRGYNIIGPGAYTPMTAPVDVATNPPPRERRVIRRSGEPADAGYIIVGSSTPPGEPFASPLPAQAIPSPYAMAAQDISAKLPAQDRLALAPGVPLEQRRNLLELYAKLGNVEMAEAVARLVFAEAPDDRATLLALASLYVEQQQTDKALYTAQRLAALYPNDSEALYYLGAAYAQAGRFEEAQKTFTTIKYEGANTATGQPFKYQADLASAAYQAGDLRVAREVYQEVAVAPETKEELRAEAQRLLKQLSHELDPQLSAEATGYLLGEGNIVRTKAAWRQPVGSRYALTAQYSREDVHVNSTPALRDRGTSSNDGTISAEAKFNRNWSASATVGGWEGGAQGAASVTRHLGGKGELKLEAALNERALDSLLMESLDGREHRATLTASYLLHPRWLAYATVTGRETLIDDQQLGAGVHANWNFEHIFLNDDRYLGVGYRGFYFRHSLRTQNVGLVAPAMAPGATPADQQAALANMIAPFLHREGAYLTWSHQFAPSFAWFAGGGADYELDRSHMAYNGLGGLTWTPFARLELRTELDYFTSARTSDQSSDLWQISLALRAWF
ncbi:MAG: tetratricopeptide repeat protein [Verrucomicrobia bacterium]|nr:tetratricopeptide repeat protein [Verrucomicrobiota bacterium]